MFSFVRRSLELKIILTLAAVIALSVGTYTYVDIEHVRTDMIRTSERTLGAFAVAIQASVSASMKKGQHQMVPQILNEVSAPAFIDRLVIYDEQGRPLHGRETLHDQNMLDITIPPSVHRRVQSGDLSDLQQRNGQYFISYYAPIANGRDCHRCHGSTARLNGILRIDFSLHELDDLLAARRNRDIVWSVGLIVILVVVLTLLLRVVINSPVRELRDSMALAAEGGAVSSLSLDGQDELGDLKRSFVAMLERIRKLHQTNADVQIELAHVREVSRFRNELQAMFDAMPDGVLMVDRDRSIIQNNRRAFELLPHLQGRDRIVPAPGEDPGTGPLQCLTQAFVEGRIIEKQVPLSREDGSVRHLHTICAPVIEEGQVVFVVGTVRDITSRIRTGQELEERTKELKRTNRLLAKLAVTDGLTQLFNRRHFDDLLYKEIKRFNRRKYTAISLMMIDIDHFKALNDHYGHLAGDSVLREIATVLKQEVRETDTIARYGGEEFVIVLPDTYVDGAGHKADLIRRRVQALDFPGAENPIKITISIGVAEYYGGFPHDLVQAADKALYQAKQGGRNTVVVKRRDEVEA
jgi:diguanylate cyclase (GGDEF)-like protein/PAS domain S-box-containing protein